MEKEVKFTIKDLNRLYPNDDVCLDKIFQMRYGEMEACPKCGVIDPTYARIKKRTCYQCADCLHQIYPMVGTVFQNSTTPLTSWFYVIFLFAKSKNGVSSREIQRQIGVSHKCAWRIGHKVRELMKEDTKMLKGIVEMDETLIGGKAKGKRGWGAENKRCIFGMIERDGNIKVISVDGRTKNILLPIIKKNVEQGTKVHTDEYKGYRDLGSMGYSHATVVHSRYQWVLGDCHTNSIEGFWGNLKKSILSTHTHVSAKYLQNYLDEFCFRHNNRKGVNMFEAILRGIMNK